MAIFPYQDSVIESRAAFGRHAPLACFGLEATPLWAHFVLHDIGIFEEAKRFVL